MRVALGYNNFHLSPPLSEIQISVSESGGDTRKLLATLETMGDNWKLV